MEPLANLNGDIMPLAEVKIPALDRGFLFGDAVYEVLRVYQGRPWLADEHFERLARSLQAIRIQGVDVARLRRRMQETITAGRFQEAIVYIQITRGAAPRSHPFPAQATPLELLYVQEFDDPYRSARLTGGAVLTRPDIRWDRCDIKSTNLLANVLAMQAAREHDCVETLFCLPDGTLTEGTHTLLDTFYGDARSAVGKNSKFLTGELVVGNAGNHGPAPAFCWRMISLFGIMRDRPQAAMCAKSVRASITWASASRRTAMPAPLLTALIAM